MQNGATSWMLKAIKKWIWMLFWVESSKFMITNTPEQIFFFSNFKNLPFLNFLIIIAILLHCAMGSKEKQSVLRLWHGVKQVCSLAAASWQKTRLRCELFYRLARSHIWLGRWQRKGINIQEDSIKTGSSPS